MKVKITDKVTKVIVSNTDTYDLSTTLAKIIVPSLKKYKENPVPGTPGKILPDTKKEYTDEELEYYHQLWLDYIDRMILAFELIIADEDYADDDNRIQEGLDLFAKYYLDLWW